MAAGSNFAAGADALVNIRFTLYPKNPDNLLLTNIFSGVNPRKHI